MLLKKMLFQVKAVRPTVIHSFNTTAFYILISVDMQKQSLHPADFCRNIETNTQDVKENS